MTNGGCPANSLFADFPCADTVPGTLPLCTPGRQSPTFDEKAAPRGKSGLPVALLCVPCTCVAVTRSPDVTGCGASTSAMSAAMQAAVPAVAPGAAKRKNSSSVSGP